MILNLEWIIIILVRKYDFKKVLLRYSYIINDIEVIPIYLNLDGLPLYNSKPTQVWSLLIAINIPPKQVFPVAIILGSRKPTNLDFNIDSILEIKTLITDGLLYNNQLLYLDITAIICDAPAKSFIKQTLQFNPRLPRYSVARNVSF